MYGLVNIAIRDLIIRNHGEAAWERVRTRAGIDQTDFVSMDPYPDELTYGLVAAASEELNASAEELLELFGRHWMTFTASQGYGMALDFAGADVEEFLSNLDDMHARLSLSFPALRPPSFDVERVADGRLRLHYHSERTGLAPMVIGLLRGVGDRFGVELDLEHVAAGAGGEDHDSFLIRLGQEKGSEAA